MPNEKAGGGSQVGEFQIVYTGTGQPRGPPPDGPVWPAHPGGMGRLCSCKKSGRHGGRRTSGVRPLRRLRVTQHIQPLGGHVSN